MIPHPRGHSRLHKARTLRRTIFPIVILAIAALTLGGCITQYGSNANTVMTFLNRTDDETVNRFSKEERRDVMDFVFEDTLPYIDPKAFDAMMADPVKLRNDLRGSFFAQSYANQVAGGSVPNTAKDEDQAAWRSYLGLLRDFNAEVVDARLALLQQRLGDWYEFMRPSTLQMLVWDDTAFKRFMEDDAYARSLLVADGTVMIEYRPAMNSSPTTSAREIRWDYLWAKNNGFTLNPNPLTTRTGS